MPAKPAALAQSGARPCACGRPAVVSIPYSGERLCRSDFLSSVERRVKREVRRQGPYPPGSVVAVGLSGGKDSVTALRLLHEIFAPRPDVRLVAVGVDEGIASYRPPSLGIAEEHAHALNVPFHRIAYRDLGARDMDALVPAHPERAACAMCGPLRRQALNEAALRVGATRLATGHNLDDTAQTILMNLLHGDVARLLRLAPHEEGVPGLVPRMLPLRTIPEREVALYAHLRGWKYHDGECPYSTDASRGRYRDALLDFEEREPGTRHALLATHERIVALARGTERSDLRACARCEAPTSGEVCAACALREDDA